MYAEQINSHWSREPIFASANTNNAFFCHLLYKGQPVATARAERVGEDEWEALVEDENGNMVHMMDEVYATHTIAINDIVDWYTGQ